VRKAKSWILAGGDAARESSRTVFEVNADCPAAAPGGRRPAAQNETTSFRGRGAILERGVARGPVIEERVM
jgi:hypothetical protein